MATIDTNPAPPARQSWLHRFVDEHPWRFAILVTTALGAIGALLFLVAPRPVDDHPIVVLGYDAARYSLALGLLAALGWWGRVGMTRRPAGRPLLAFLPLSLILLLQLFTARLGTTQPGRILLIMESMLAAGFTEEVLFRGIVLRALVPMGLWRAAVGSSLLFGGLHVTGLLVGADPMYVALQVVWATLVGFSLAGPVLVTGWIWPAVLFHFGVNVISTLAAGRLVQTQRPDAAAMASLAVVIAIFALLAGFSAWLLLRHVRTQPIQSVGTASFE